MAEQNKVTEQQQPPVTTQDFNIDEFKDTARQTFDRYKNLIYGGLIVLVIVVGGLYYYFSSRSAGNKAADDLIFQAQFYFEQDSFDKALKGVHIPGQPEVMGFLDIIENYGGSNAANVSHFYAGIALLQLGEYERSIKFLNNYSGNDGITQAQAYGAIGDAQSELGKMDEALAAYQKAANYQPNEATSPYFLRKAGLLSEFLKKNDEAKKYYERIQKEFPQAGENMNIEKDIIRVTQQY